jgi:hypothetical protein
MRRLANGVIGTSQRRQRRRKSLISAISGRQPPIARHQGSKTTLSRAPDPQPTFRLSSKLVSNPLIATSSTKMNTIFLVSGFIPLEGVRLAQAPGAHPWRASIWAM